MHFITIRGALCACQSRPQQVPMVLILPPSSGPMSPLHRPPLTRRRFQPMTRHVSRLTHPHPHRLRARRRRRPGRQHPNRLRHPQRHPRSIRHHPQRGHQPAHRPVRRLAFPQKTRPMCRHSHPRSILRGRRVGYPKLTFRMAAAAFCMCCLCLVHGSAAL